MRAVNVFGAALFLFATNSWAQQEQTACALLPAQRVSSIVGMRVRIEQAGSETTAQPRTCSYRGEGVAIRLVMHMSNSELDARKDFVRQLAEVFSNNAYQSLRGVGAEARFGVIDRSGSGAIVVRYDTTVIVLSGSQDQSKLVALVRSAIAQLSAVAHEAHP